MTGGIRPTHPKVTSRTTSTMKTLTKLYPTTDHGIGDRWQVRWRDKGGGNLANFAYRDRIDPEARCGIRREDKTRTRHRAPPPT